MNPVTRLTLLCAAASLFAFAPANSFAQEKESKPLPKNPPEPAAAPPKEESSVTDHSIKIGGQSIPYKATVGSMLLKNEKDEPEALLFFTSYIRSDVKDLSQRSIAFVYNGGPGSASLWLHMGSFGPKRVATVNAGVTPPAPYKLDDNPNCLLDKTDLVFIDPVGTGFSRAVGKAQDKDFWGVDQDARSLANFVQSYISRNNRWNSPKFLIGESYGTFRNAVLSNVLLTRYNVYLNGLVMISSVWDLGTISFYPGNDLSYIVYLPSYAATAWYHKVLTDRPDNLPAFLDEVRRFANGEYADALLKGSTISDAEKSAVAKKVARYTGLSEDYVLKSNLRVKLFQFMQELQRSRGLTTGRLDARFSGPTYNLISDSADYDPQEAAISGAFVATASINTCAKSWKYNPDREIPCLRQLWGEPLGLEALRGRRRLLPGLSQRDARPRQRHDHQHQAPGGNGRRLLRPRHSFRRGPIRHRAHSALPPNIQRKTSTVKTYEAGHMMYLRDEDLSKLKSNVAAFLDSASKPQ